MIPGDDLGLIPHLHKDFSFQFFSPHLKNKGSQDESGINPLVEQGHNLCCSEDGYATGTP